MTVLDAGSEMQKSEILPRIADGSLIATAALLEEDARYSPQAIRMPLESREGEYVANALRCSSSMLTRRI